MGRPLFDPFNDWLSSLLGLLNFARGSALDGVVPRPPPLYSLAQTAECFRNIHKRPFEAPFLRISTALMAGLSPLANNDDLSALLIRKTSSSIEQARITKAGDLCEKCKECLTWLLTLDYHQEGYWTSASHKASCAFHYDDFAVVRRSAQAGCYLCGQIVRIEASRLIFPGDLSSMISRRGGRMVSRRPTLGPSVPYLFDLEYPEGSGPDHENVILTYKLQLRNLIAVGMFANLATVGTLEAGAR